jgi:hypothetical protein
MFTGGVPLFVAQRGESDGFATDLKPDCHRKDLKQARSALQTAFDDPLTRPHSTRLATRTDAAGPAAVLAAGAQDLLDLLLATRCI